MSTATVATEYLAERIKDAQHWAWSVASDLTDLRDETLSWQRFYGIPENTPGGRREMQARAIAECSKALDQAERDLASLKNQAEKAAMERQGGNTG